MLLGWKEKRSGRRKWMQTNRGRLLHKSNGRQSGAFKVQHFTIFSLDFKFFRKHGSGWWSRGSGQGQGRGEGQWQGRGARRPDVGFQKRDSIQLGNHFALTPIQVLNIDVVLSTYNYIGAHHLCEGLRIQTCFFFNISLKLNFHLLTIVFV